MNIEVSALSFSYGINKVLSDVTFTARGGELLSVLGPNGVGKSTLFKCMLGLLGGFKGRVLVGGKDASRLSASELARLIAYIPQVHHPVFNFAVLDVVLMGTARNVNAISSPGKKETEQAYKALEQIGIADLVNKSYLKLSGGEQQLVLIARALAQQAETLLMDEPTSNLDFGNQLRVLQEARRLADSGLTVIMSSHNPQHALDFSDSILALKDGRAAAWGPPDKVLDEALMRRLYGVDVRIVSTGGRRVIIPLHGGKQQ